MKWLSNRYAYPLVIFVIVVSVALQLAWLSQLFKAQRVQIKRDMEQAVVNAAKMSTYLSAKPDKGTNENFKKFFLSSEWLQFSQAYHNMRFHQVGSRFSFNIVGDSTIFDISLRFINGKPNVNRHRRTMRFDDGDTEEHERTLDQLDLKRMDSLVHQQLKLEGIRVTANHAVYNYDYDTLASGSSKDQTSQAAFSSQQYTYNLTFFHTYQLVVPSINWAVFYRMRYYLFSSCFMLILTGAVFFFILRLMYNQRVYAEARLSFTSNMTHELKTPVATVAIALESIMEYHLEGDPQTLKNYLEISRSELKRLNLMIEKVLNLEQLDSDQTHLRKELFDVQQGLQQVIASMRLQIENAGAELTWHPLDKPCFVTGDPVHLTNVFYNLIENALKYGGKGVKLNVSCTANAREVTVSFKDNGPGIAGIYHDRVFERFFRVPANSADVHNVKGTGLGLNYVQQMVEKHGGHIKLISEPGKGSNFIIHLPLASS
jgi:signal transduction histidine kinase